MTSTALAYINLDFDGKRRAFMRGEAQDPKGPFVPAYCLIDIPDGTPGLDAAELAFEASNAPHGCIRPLYNGPSLSVGDVVMVHDEGGATYFLVEPVGFKEIDNPDLTLLPEAAGLLGTWYSVSTKQTVIPGYDWGDIAEAAERAAERAQ